MNYSLRNDYAAEYSEMRPAFRDTMLELAEANRNILLMDADLMSAVGCLPFRDRFPEQTVDCGIQEANMVGSAAGLSLVGKIPFAHSFASFISRRCFDQSFLSGGYAQANVKLIGSDPGITAETNGGTHVSFEDMGLMRLIPGMTVMEASDDTMFRSLLRASAKYYGMVYLRLYRKPLARLYTEGSEFTIGESARIREGRDVTIVSSGICTAEALKAHDMLLAQGISSRVIDCYCWKPIDEPALIEAAVETGAVVTAENHNVINGLGAAVCSVLAQNSPVPVECVGIPDVFGEVGPISYLMDLYGLTAEHIKDAAIRAVMRKA